MRRRVCRKVDTTKPSLVKMLIMRPEKSGGEKFTNEHLEIRLILQFSIHCMSVCQTEVLSEEIGEKQISIFCFKGDQNIPLMRITLC